MPYLPMFALLLCSTTSIFAAAMPGSEPDNGFVSPTCSDPNPSATAPLVATDLTTQIDDVCENYAPQVGAQSGPITSDQYSDYTTNLTYILTPSDGSGDLGITVSQCYGAFMQIATTCLRPGKEPSGGTITIGFGDEGSITLEQRLSSYFAPVDEVLSEYFVTKTHARTKNHPKTKHSKTHTSSATLAYSKRSPDAPANTLITRTIMASDSRVTSL